MKNLAVLFLFVFTQVAFAQTDDARKKNFNIKKNAAIDGYDPVSYFDGKPAEGDSKFSNTHKGVTYLFSSLVNLNKFKANPEKYEPAYGGGGAYAMGEKRGKEKKKSENYKIIKKKKFFF